MHARTHALTDALPPLGEMEREGKYRKKVDREGVKKRRARMRRKILQIRNRKQVMGGWRYTEKKTIKMGGKPVRKKEREGISYLGTRTKEWQQKKIKKGKKNYLDLRTCRCRHHGTPDYKDRRCYTRWWWRQECDGEKELRGLKRWHVLPCHQPSTVSHHLQGKLKEWNESDSISAPVTRER